VLDNPVRSMKLSRVSNVILTCLILRNMRIEEYVSGVNNKYRPDDGIDIEQFNDSSINKRYLDDDSEDDEDDNNDNNDWVE
jgi:hypothetical protein